MKNTTAFVDSRVAKLLFRFLAAIMDSRWRYSFGDPVAKLKGARVRTGEQVLEVGCGTGFFTVPAVYLVDEEGRVYAQDSHPLPVEQVSRKMEASVLTIVALIRADAMQAGLCSGCIDLDLLLGVIPAPILPLERLLPEMHRLLQPEGALALWTDLPWWLPASVARSGLFVRVGKENGVHSLVRTSV